MLGRKETSRLKKVQADEERVDGASVSDTTLTTTITTTSGHILTISEFISRFDEAAKKRVDNMNQKLRVLEEQMEALEAEMSKADGNA